MTHDELLVQLQYDRPERYLEYASALRAVVKLPDRDPKFNINSYEGEWSHGYNQALADVKAVIEKELGMTEGATYDTKRYKLAPINSVILNETDFDYTVFSLQVGMDGLQSVHFPSNVAKRIMNEVNCWRCSHQTPTEPKGYATLLRANESGFIARPRWQKSIITNLWCSSDGNLDVPYHQLVNPVVVEKE